MPTWSGTTANTSSVLGCLRYPARTFHSKTKAVDWWLQTPLYTHQCERSSVIAQAAMTSRAVRQKTLPHAHFTPTLESALSTLNIHKECRDDIGWFTGCSRVVCDDVTGGPPHDPSPRTFHSNTRVADR